MPPTLAGTLAALAALGAAWPALAQPLAIPPPPPVIAAHVQSAAEASAQDAVEYARRYAVSAEEALRRIRALDVSVAATDALQAEFSDRLAGVWIEHQPALHIVVLLTGAAPVADRLLATGDLEIPVMFRTGATATRAAVVDAIAVHQVAIRRALPIVQGIGADPRTGEMLLMVRATDAAFADTDALAEDAAQIAGVPARVRLLGALEKLFSIDGGSRVEGVEAEEPATPRRYVCTTGFVVTDGVRNGVVTAAHCPDALTYVDPAGTRTPLDFVGQWGARYQDVQINVGGEVRLPLFYADGRRSLSRMLTGWRNRTGTRAGDFVCHRGERTGYSCSEVELVDYAPADPLCAGPCDPVWVTVAGPSCRGGDSGGPVFSGTTAFGILKGGSYDPDGTCGFYYYMSTDYLPEGWSLLRG